MLVGRETETGVLEGAFEAAEAGGGKSRLVTEFAVLVRARAVVLAGGCVDAPTATRTRDQS